MVYCQQCLFYGDFDGVICPECAKHNSIYNTQQQNELDAERTLFLESIRKSDQLFFAFSGGKDSVVALCKLYYLIQSMECNCQLRVFTIDNGVKGSRTWQNIYNVINYLGLIKSHEVINIADCYTNVLNTILGIEKIMKVKEIYCYCLEHGILPCGQVCNSILNPVYEQIIQKNKLSYIVTGGDTPKFSDGRYSIFWKKNPNLTIVRGGVIFKGSKLKNTEYIEKHRIPWVEPHCGGYDTDCLVPGYYFKEISDSLGDLEISKISPVVNLYVSERVRMGIIPLQQGQQLLKKYDLPDRESFLEMDRIIKDSD